MEVIFKDEIVKFSKNGDTFAIKESGGVKVQIMETLISKRIIIIINCQNGSEKPKKFSKSRMSKWTAPLNSSREI